MAVGLAGGPLDRLLLRALAARGLAHNGVALARYPERDWNLAALPAAKGVPFDADNLVTVNDHSFLDEARFRAAAAAAEGRWRGAGHRDVRWRLHTVLWAATVADRRDPAAAFVELGVGRGYMAAGICAWLDWPAAGAPPSRRFVLVDSFQALPQQDGRTIAGAERPFFYTDDVDEVRAAFAGRAGVEVHRGTLPAALDDLDLADVGFLHVDLNDAGAERDSLEAVRPALASGCLVVLDDSGNPGCGPQLAVHRAWARALGTELLQLPTGQALCVVP